MEKKKSKFKLYLKAIKKRIKLKDIIVLMLLLTVNTYAWFVYSTEVKSSVDVHIRGWEIDFRDADVPIVDYVTFAITDVYPGMPDYEKVLEAFNHSDLSASLTYKVLSAHILDDEYITVDGKIEAGEEVTGDEPTSDEILRMLEEDYPFTITVDASTTRLSALDGQSNFDVTMVWPYESGDDEADTYYGNAAYDFIEANPDTPCISIVIKIYISQSEMPAEPEPESDI